MPIRSLCLLCLVASSAHADRFVVVPSDAPLYEQPSREGPTASVSRTRARSLQHLVFRVVGERPDFFEIESVDEPGQHCYESPPDLRAVALRAFVRRSDLRSVTTRETTIALGDGASVTLGNGLAVVTASGTSRVSADDWSLRLAVPQDVVGVVYEPRAMASLGDTDQVTTPGPLRIAGQPLFDLSYPLPAYAVTPRTNDALATIVVRCAHFRLSLPRGRIKAADDNILGGLVGPGSPGLTVREGAPVYWRDGARAGSMRRAFTFTPSRTSAPGRRCGQVGEMAICFDPQDTTQRSRAR